MLRTDTPGQLVVGYPPFSSNKHTVFWESRTISFDVNDDSSYRYEREGMWTLFLAAVWIEADLSQKPVKKAGWKFCFFFFDIIKFKFWLLTELSLDWITHKPLTKYYTGRGRKVGALHDFLRLTSSYLTVVPIFFSCTPRLVEVRFCEERLTVHDENAICRTWSFPSGIGRSVGPKQMARLYGSIIFSSLNSLRWLRNAKRYRNTSCVGCDNFWISGATCRAQKFCWRHNIIWSNFTKKIMKKWSKRLKNKV